MRWERLVVICFLVMLFLPVPLPADQGEDNRPAKGLISPEELRAGIVSLDSSVTEIILALEAGQFLKGITVHDMDALRRAMPDPPEDLAIVGSFFAPDVEKIGEIFKGHRGVIFTHGFHSPIAKELSLYGRVMNFPLESPEDLFKTIRTLGLLLERKEKAERLVTAIKSQLEIISRKTARIPLNRRKRVVRFMGRKDSDTLYVPGDDSFQNLFIRLAGGVPPYFGKRGSMVPITVDEWKSFNPQVIYGCGSDREAAEKFFALPGWKDVDAVKTGQIYYFPCDLTCRFSIYSGLFVQWLASTLYREEFSDPKNIVEKEKILTRQDINPPLELDYVASAEIVESRIYDFRHKTLLVRFTEPVDIISTLEGPRKGIEIVGNNFSPPPCWHINHGLGFNRVKKHTLSVLGLDPVRTSLLYTGADMDNLSVKKATHESLVVYALVTAGVRGNALRTSRDEGTYEEPGTINIIIMTNRHLSPGAMTRAIITATEAKTAALQDLDTRSTSNPAKWQATGTGTDEIIVVSGKGPEANLAGGHTKLGQLIAESVYRAVLDAIRKQNGITLDRTVPERLEERGIELYRLVDSSATACSASMTRKDIMVRLYRLLLSDPWASFVKIALAANDLYTNGLIKDFSLFQQACGAVSPFTSYTEDLVPADALPPDTDLLRMALDALLSCVMSPSCQESCVLRAEEVVK